MCKQNKTEFFFYIVLVTNNNIRVDFFEIICQIPKFDCGIISASRVRCIRKINSPNFAFEFEFRNKCEIRVQFFFLGGGGHL